MAPRVKVTKEMITEAGFSIVREQGEEKLNVRNVAARIGCSTQPIMYCYPTVAEMKTDVLARANEFHTDCLIKKIPDDTEIFVGIGLNYIRFANEERHLFKFICLSDQTQGSGIAELINGDDSEEFLAPIARKHGISTKEARDAFEAIFASFHGYAILIAYNMLQYDEPRCRVQLKRIYDGVIERIIKEADMITMTF